MHRLQQLPQHSADHKDSARQHLCRAQREARMKGYRVDDPNPTDACIHPPR
jgi:hypothetical protein